MRIKTNKDLKKHFKLHVDNKMRVYGETDFEKKRIRINKKKSKNSGRAGEVLDTIAHEEMHAKHPQMHEHTVRRKTKQLVLHMSYKQKQRAYARY